MKKLLTIIALAIFTTAASQAACGTKVTDEGTLKAVNADTKAITIETADGKTVSRTLTPTSTSAGKDGKAAEASALVGKKVKVVSEHNKIDSLAEA